MKDELYGLPGPNQLGADVPRPQAFTEPARCDGPQWQRKHRCKVENVKTIHFYKQISLTYCRHQSLFFLGLRTVSSRCGWQMETHWARSMLEPEPCAGDNLIQGEGGLLRRHHQIQKALAATIATALTKDNFSNSGSEPLWLWDNCSWPRPPTPTHSLDAKGLLSIFQIYSNNIQNLDII